MVGNNDSVIHIAKQFKREVSPFVWAALLQACQGGEMKQVHPCKINLEVEIRIGFTTKRRRMEKHSKSSTTFRFQMSGHCGLERRARTSLLQCSSLPVMNHYSSHGSRKGAMVESAKMTLCCFIAKTPLLQISHFKT